MGAPKDPITGLTLQQDAFAHAVASGLNQSDAYRQSYNVSPDALPETTHSHASHLAAVDNVAARIQTLKDAAALHAVRAAGWDRVRLISEAEQQLSDARTGGWRGVASGNGALEIIGRATGLLSDKAKEQAPLIVTRITLVLDRGTDAEGNRRIVEGEVRELTSGGEPPDSGPEPS